MRFDVGQIGNLRPIVNRPFSPIARAPWLPTMKQEEIKLVKTGRLPIGRRVPLCPTMVAIIFITRSVALHAAETPKQPVPFSHKQHAGDLKLACKMCHPNPEPGERMTIVGTAACMQCHSAIKTESPAIQKLAALDRNKRPMPWVPVYAVPSFVDFSHKVHTSKGAICQDCHGAVAEKNELARESDLSMGGCIACHKQKEAPIGCTACHEQKE